MAMSHILLFYFSQLLTLAISQCWQC